MDIRKIWILALPLLLVVSCSSGENSPQPPKKNVFDPLMQQEQRARDVQKTVDENAARQRQAVDAQERGDAAP